MQKIRELSKERLTTEDTTKEMLLGTDGEEMNVWHNAVYRGKLDVMQKILERGKRE